MFYRCLLSYPENTGNKHGSTRTVYTCNTREMHEKYTQNTRINTEYRYFSTYLYTFSAPSTSIPRVLHRNYTGIGGIIVGLNLSKYMWFAPSIYTSFTHNTRCISKANTPKLTPKYVYFQCNYWLCVDRVCAWTPEKFSNLWFIFYLLEQF